MKVLMVASECFPFAKSGGLADVVGALPSALEDLGHDVAIVMPFYRAVAAYLEKNGLSVEVRIASLTVPLGNSLWFGTLLEGPRIGRGVRTFFIQCDAFYDRKYLYGPPLDAYSDNDVRFAFFCSAALEGVKHFFAPDVLHCHDWQASLIPVLKDRSYRFDWAWNRVPVVLTIHNLGWAYQGRFSKDAMARIGLDWQLFTADRLEQYDAVNLLKGGVVFSNAVTTVSPTYSREIQTPQFGAGLDGVLRDHVGKLRGILNGVDYKVWNPELDTAIAKTYSPADLFGKQECKRQLLREFKLSEDLHRPLIGVVARLEPEKMRLVIEARRQIFAEDVAMVVLGTGSIEQEFRNLESEFPGKVSVKIDFNDPIAHRIEAGADMFLMPSETEPCGLNQMYSLKYGTPPIVFKTGGLNDTVDAEVGFKFEDYNIPGIMWAVRAALAACHDRERWTKMMLAGMARDHSWAASAREYEKVYQSLL
jgi:starch synthase